MDIKKKLLSRKLWVAIITAAGGIAVALGAPDNIVSVIAGAATALVAVVTYIITEGKIDAAAVNLSADFAKKLIDAVNSLQAGKDDT